MIPLVLLLVTAIIRKVVEGKPFKREHWYLGIDLTIYFLASTMVNFLDIAKANPVNSMSIIWTVVLLLGAVVMLFIQIGLHQWGTSLEGRSKLQKLMLCYFANALGILMLYGFVKLKTQGLI
ncbi:MAG TPA: hypothetical protein VFE38_08900 [Edaphobacter sp.]|nr:hypothetical protein [Edaphobacter sp.]